MSGFRRTLFGYRPREVEEALRGRDAALAARDAELAGAAAELAGCRRRIVELELVAERLSECAAERDGELRRVRAKLDQARAESAQALRTFAVLAEEIEGIRAQARGQATRIRMAALAEAAGRGRPAVVDSGGGDQGLEIEALTDERSAGTAEAPDVAAAALVNGTARIADDIYVGSVEVDVGPLTDFSQLVGFEDAAGGIAAASEISVTRFAQGRATLALKLVEPVELLRELEERAPFEFRVRDTRADRLVIDVDGE